MEYDKNSFLAGLSVGTQLKGWACYPSELLSRISWNALILRGRSTDPASFAAAFNTAFQVKAADFIVVTSFSEVT